MICGKLLVPQKKAEVPRKKADIPPKKPPEPPKKKEEPKKIVVNPPQEEEELSTIPEDGELSLRALDCDWLLIEKLNCFTFSDWLIMIAKLDCCTFLFIS